MVSVLIKLNLPSKGLPHYDTIEVIGHAPNSQVCAAISAASYALQDGLFGNMSWQVQVQEGDCRLYCATLDAVAGKQKANLPEDRFIDFYVTELVWLHKMFPDCFKDFVVQKEDA